MQTYFPIIPEPVVIYCLANPTTASNFAQTGSTTTKFNTVVSKRPVHQLEREIAEPIPWLPRPSLPLELETNSFGIGLGETLTQNERRNEFLSRILSSAER